MLRRSQLHFFSAVPVYNRSNRRVGSNSARPSFLTPHSSTKFYDQTTNSQIRIDRKATHMPPTTRTLQHLSNQRQVNMIRGATRNPLSGGKSYRNVKSYFTMINPRYRDRFEFEAPWFYTRSKHEKRQLASKSAHAVEVTGSDDHIVNAGDSLDRAAFDLASLTSPRWPIVKKSVFEAFEWWREMDLVVSSSLSEQLDDEKIEKRLNKISLTQIRAMKHRTFSAMLQGYTCCLGNFRSIPMELALVSGFADQVAGLSTTLREDVAESDSSSRLLSLLIQVLFIGLLRHQSVADFRNLGLTQIGRFAQHPVGLEKLPNLVALSMRRFMRKRTHVKNQQKKNKNTSDEECTVSTTHRDVDGAIRLGYAACVYCSEFTDDTSSSQFGITSIPINCTIRNANQKIPQHLLEDHFPYSRPFMTLCYGWGWNHRMCKDINDPKCAAWLFEMSVVALVSLVANGRSPCGVKMRVLRSIQLVSSSCARWVELMKTGNDKNKNKNENKMKNAHHQFSMSDSEKWSSASILISIKKLAPVLEMLSIVEEQEQQQEHLLEGGMKLIGDDSTTKNSLEAVAEERNEKNENGNKKRSATSKPSPMRNPFLINSRTNQQKANNIRPTSYSAAEVGVPIFASSANTSSSSDNYNQENDEHYAASFFGKTMKKAARECLLQIAPYFEVDLEKKIENSNEERNNQLLLDDNNESKNEEVDENSSSTSSSSGNSSNSSRFNVPRSVIAEVADACEFMTQCAVFDDENSSKKMMHENVEDYVYLKRNYEKLSEAMQEIVLAE